MAKINVMSFDQYNSISCALHVYISIIIFFGVVNIALSLSLFLSVFRTRTNFCSQSIVDVQNIWKCNKPKTQVVANVIFTSFSIRLFWLVVYVFFVVVVFVAVFRYLTSFSLHFILFWSFQMSTMLDYVPWF